MLKGLAECSACFRADSALLLAVVWFCSSVCAFMYTFIQIDLAEDGETHLRLVHGRAEDRSLSANHFPFSVSQGKREINKQ